MAEILDFDPAKDLQVLETFTYEEEVEREEKVRFYTLDEQVTDYYERRVPLGKVTRYALEKLQRDADRVRALYEQTIIATDTDYEVKGERPHRGFLPWVTPVYATPLQKTKLEWGATYTPLFASRQPRFYERLMPGLHRPYVTGPGRAAKFANIQRFVDSEGKNPIQALPIYERTQGVIHEGGRYEAVPVEMPNTNDAVSMTGYWIGKRGVDLVSPLDQHPILGSADAHFYQSDADYLEIMPSVEAILTHGVPITPHPFRDAKPYLKVYDVRWTEIPWGAWKRQFPSADPMTTGLPPEPINLPAGPAEVPSESLQKSYYVPFAPGLAPRYWLSLQRDAGGLVSKLLLTQAGDLTPIALPNPVEAPFAESTIATPDDCLPDGVSFDDFLTRGVYRPPGVCVPLDVIAREISEAGVKGRLPWGETTVKDITDQYLPLLQAVQGPEPDKPKEAVIPKIEIPPLSQLRENVLAIQRDPQRTTDDKAEALRILVKDMPLQNHLFLDEDAKFLLCEHTLAIFSGELGRDSRRFYENWCGIVEGARVCKFCGEAVNRDVFVNVTDFDDDGMAVIHQDVAGVPEFHPGAVKTFAENLQTLRKLFDTNDPAQDAMFLLLSVLQALPDQAQLEPVLGQVRRLSQFTKPKGDSAQAIVGVCGLAILMQIHEPFLVPRRSFGTSFILTGYPREGKEGDKSIVDSLLQALKVTFTQFRGSFRGPSVGLLREIFKDASKVREKCMATLKVLARPPPPFIAKLGLTDYSDRLDIAAARFAQAPPEPVVMSALVPNFRIDTTSPAKRASTECVPATQLSYWTTGTPPRALQDPLVFRTLTLPGTQARPKEPAVSVRTEWGALPTSTAARLSKEPPAFAKNLRGLPLVKTLADRSAPARQITALASRLLDKATGIPVAVLRGLRSELERIPPSASEVQIRDASRGIAYAVLEEVAKIPKLRENWAGELPMDLPLRALLRTPASLTGDLLELTTRERITYKTRLGELPDMEREQIKQLLDANLAPYIISLQDRVTFAKQLEERVMPIVDPMADPHVPEEGFANQPLDTEQNDPELGEAGDYGTMANRAYGGDDVYGEMDPSKGV